MVGVMRDRYRDIETHSETDRAMERNRDRETQIQILERGRKRDTETQ